MEAYRTVVLWHKIVLSLPVWFLVEIVAKKPWKWSLYNFTCTDCNSRKIRRLFVQINEGNAQHCPVYNTKIRAAVTLFASVRNVLSFDSTHITLIIIMKYYY